MSALQYETLTSSQLTQLALRALKAYPDPVQGELRLLCRSENATFVIETPTQRYALRLHRGHYHDQQAIESELMWLDALRAADIQAPEALYDRQGERVQKLQLDGEHRYAVIFHWMDGEMPTTDVSPEAFYQLGEITAQLHQHSRQWQAPAAFKRIIWNHETMVGPQGHWGDWRAASGLPAEDHPLIEAALSQIQQSLVEYGQSPERYGLIHADLRLTNLLRHQQQTRVIDFDDCGQGWYLHDLAAALSFEEHHPNAPLWAERWLAGYQAHCPLSAADLAILPSLFLQRRLQMTAWIASHAETETVRQLDADWMQHTLRLCRQYLAQPERWPLGC
ncbi:phosphotransferase [Pseudomonas sp.]|uniref:phosphotransferase enzyme family protein n=1 Tax=Gammaproteobacteria TaxID=1236 RepID=UPI0032428D8F|nr:phosphotransferase [Halopseudomonas pachastrellae]